MYRILITDKLDQAGLDRLDEIDDVGYDMKIGLSAEKLQAIIPDYHALIVRSGTQVTAELLTAATNLQVVGRAGIGIDNIDVDAATLRGITVMNTPGANSIATTEQTMVLMLAASRYTSQSHASLLAGEWKRTQFVGTELYGKTLGVIGFGRVGRLVAERAMAFGMEVIAYDPFVSEAVGREMGVLLVDLEDLLPEADYVSLHTAVTPETTHLINADTIAQMRKGVILVNAARGRLIDEPALAAALQNGQVKAAALDVFSSEPPKNNPLIGLPQVLHTPHLGASTVEAQCNVATQMVDQVVDALRQADFRNAINMPFQAGIDFRAIRPFITLAEKIGNLQTGLAEGPIHTIEVEVRGDEVEGIVRAIASGLLIGLLDNAYPEPLNVINAPVIAAQKGIKITQTTGKNHMPDNYPNVIACRVMGTGWEHLVAGTLFSSGAPGIIQLDDYKLDVRPEGSILLLKNKDVPGVMGQIGTILAAYEVNIGEWRMGRDEPGGISLSFINLDSIPPQSTLDTLERITAVTEVKLVNL